MYMVISLLLLIVGAVFAVAYCLNRLEAHRAANTEDEWDAPYAGSAPPYILIPEYEPDDDEPNFADYAEAIAERDLTPDSRPAQAKIVNIKEPARARE